MNKNENHNHFIAITGCGSISPLGSVRSEIFEKYLSNSTCFENRQFNNKIYPVGVIPKQTEVLLEKFIANHPKSKKADRTVHLAMFAASIAFNEAEWKTTPGLITGINIGSSRGSTGLFEQLHEDFILDKDRKTSIHTSPLTTLGYVSNQVAALLNIHGPIINTSVTCSTGLQAICNAIAWIKSGMAHRFIIGGTEAPLTKFTIAQVEALGIYSNLIDSEYPCMPLADKETIANTFVLGEGAAAFTLEKINVDESKKRKTLGIIESVGFSFEKPPSIAGISKDGSLLVSSMQMALDNMITHDPVDLILLHSPGTVKGDEAEYNAVKLLFKENMPNLFSNKWKIGHTYAASSALNLELALLCIQHNFSPAFPYKSVVKNKQRDIRKIMINATGFGGNATSIIISHPAIIE